MAFDTRSLEIWTVDYLDRYINTAPFVSTPTNTFLNALIDAFVGMSKANLVTSLEVSRQFRIQGSPVTPSDQQALNEVVWLVSGVSSGNGQVVQMVIPAANTDLLAVNSDRPDTSTPEYIAFVSALADAWADDNGDPVNLSEIIISGR